jgi:CRISPR-associated exonuclease Cas4
MSINTHKLKNKYKIQNGKIVYSDLEKPGKPFFSKRYRITGKPDYIVMRNKRYIPVELKTGSHNKPQKNHIFQLAGYCHLLEENYGGFVPYGIIVYSEGNSYKISFDPKIRFEFESTLLKMRHILKTGNITRNHNDFHKCKNCSMRIYCQNKLS